MARALNAGAAADPSAVDDLAAAVDAVGQAQEGGGDVRAALADLRTAERVVTEAAVAAVAGDDRPPDASTLGAAVRAVLADPDALAALRAGRLADVPGGGGFGLGGPGADLAAAPRKAAAKRTPAPPATRTSRGAPTTADAKRTSTRGSGGRAAAASKAEPKALVAARRAVADAEGALRRAEGGVEEVQQEVAAAEADEQAARDAADEAARRADEARDRALEVARVATTARREAAARTRRRDEAAAALAKAEARLAKLEPG